MSLTPIQRAESLLTEAVMTLYAGFRDNSFPEHYVFSMARTKMVMRLGEQTHRAKTVRPPVAPLPPPDGSSYLQALDADGYGRLLATADKKLAEAVDALWEGGPAFVEDYIKRSAQNHMATCLRWLRAQESPAERSALVSEVNRLRASVGCGPVRWEEIVTPSR